MTSFRFPLKRILDWRRPQLELEETRYKEQSAELAALDHARAEMRASEIRAEMAVREWNPVVGEELVASSAFQQPVKKRETQIAKCGVRPTARGTAEGDAGGAETMPPAGTARRAKTGRVAPLSTVSWKSWRRKVISPGGRAVKYRNDP